MPIRRTATEERFNALRYAIEHGLLRSPSVDALVREMENYRSDSP